MLRLVTHMYETPNLEITTYGPPGTEDKSQASAKDTPYHHSYLYFL